MNYKFQNFYLMIYIILFTSCVSKQKPDNNFDVSVKSPAFVNHHPKVLFDEAHFNMHTSKGTYSPFINLIKNDGFSVEVNSQEFTNSTLKKYDILVISNAKGGKYNFKYLPAFTDIETEVVKNWVYNGGSLLLIADHYPLGSASENLSMKFGVHMSNGETIDSIYFQGNDQYRDKLVFSKENKLLLQNEITQGLKKVVSDRGQSLSVPDSAKVLLNLSKSAYQTVPDSIWDVGKTTYARFGDPVSAYGNCQGLALNCGKGKVVILGEAAMLTAQVFEGEKFGMNEPDNDNKQFALNIMRWLANQSIN